MVTGLFWCTTMISLMYEKHIGLYPTYPVSSSQSSGFAQTIEYGVLILFSPSLVQRWLSFLFLWTNPVAENGAFRFSHQKSLVQRIHDTACALKVFICLSDYCCTLKWNYNEMSFRKKQVFEDFIPLSKPIKKDLRQQCFFNDPWAWEKGTIGLCWSPCKVS